MFLIERKWGFLRIRICNVDSKILTMSDEELVELSLSSEDCFSVLISRYEDKLGRYIRRRSNANKEDVQDILQEVFLKVYLNLRGFNTRLSFSSWVYRIAHNEMVSWYRKRKVRPEGNMVDIEDDTLFLMVGEIEIDVGVLKKEAEEKMFEEGLEKLPDKYRELIVLKFLEGKSYKEIGDILEMPEGTIATRINRGKKKLRDIINKMAKEYE